jgi:uncharacterized protein YndB with AHSA1/START domain
MRFLLILLFFLTVVTAGIYGAGSSLPEEMITVRGAQFKAPVDEVWDLITNYEQLPRWNDGIASVTPIPEPQTKETLWDIVDNDDRHMLLKVTHSEPKIRHRAEIMENDMPFRGSWQFTLTPNDEGTWLTLEERSIIKSPFLRFLTYYVLGSDYGIRAYLESMARHLVQEITIKELAA